MGRILFELIEVYKGSQQHRNIVADAKEFLRVNGESVCYDTEWRV